MTDLQMQEYGYFSSEDISKKKVRKKQKISC